VAEKYITCPEGMELNSYEAPNLFGTAHCSRGCVGKFKYEKCPCKSCPLTVAMKDSNAPWRRVWCNSCEICVTGAPKFEQN
jgi:hypothetical protein